MFTPSSIRVLEDLLKTSLAGDSTKIDERIDWTFITAIFKLLFLLCFNDSAIEACSSASLLDTSLRIVADAH